jgi:RNA polymerase sigma-70 factor (ECF subfamily)
MSDNQTAPAVIAVNFEDSTLVQQAQGGDAGAFARLVAKYQDRVYNVCLRISGHHEDARDLTQETFLKAFAGMGSFKGRSSFYTWLFRVAMNVSISQQRKARRAVTVGLDDVDPLVVAGQARNIARSTGNPTPRPEDRLSRRETHELVERALLTLDEHHRAVVVLRDIEGCNYEQIAEILQVAIGTVKSRLHRARMALRRHLSAALMPE